MAGTGAIGAMMGGWLTRAGYDVTMLSVFRREQARLLEERTREEWEDIRAGRKTGLEHAEEFKPWPPGIVDAYTMDMRKGLPLEIDFTNGAVVALGKGWGVPTPANEALLAAVHAVERGERAAGLPLMRALSAACQG